MKLIVRTWSTFTWKIDSTADLISGFVARRSTRKVNKLPRVLRLFLGDQGLLRNHRRLDDVPNRSHFLGRLLLTSGAAALRSSHLPCERA